MSARYLPALTLPLALAACAPPIQTPDPLPPEAPFDRISLTLPSLLASDALVFVIRGDEKRVVLDQAIAGQHDLPVARLLKAATQPVTCFT